MEAEEWGRRALAADRGGLMLRPRLLDLLSRRWYSIGDCKAERHKDKFYKAECFTKHSCGFSISFVSTSTPLLSIYEHDKEIYTNQA